MTDEQILKKAIEKAVKNGWKHTFTPEAIWDYSNNISGWYYNVIFSHDFAKAFWGERKCKCIRIPDGSVFHKDKCKERDWQFHLQIMVLEEEPLKYLEKFL